MYLVSACLAGINCRYDGKDTADSRVEELVRSGKAIAVCPELLGGLTIPRDNCEIVGSGEKNARVVNKSGEDLTLFFEDGAEKTLAIAKAIKATAAVLKSKSPSCGYGEVYDGTFTRTLRAGNGFTADLLNANGIRIYSEKNIDSLADPVILISQLQEWTPFLGSLQKLDPSLWIAPIEKGKWSIRDIVAHIMAWDKNFLEKVIPRLLKQEAVSLEEDMDVQGFNDRAVEYGKTLSQEQLLDEAVFNRTRIIAELKKLPEEAFFAVVPGSDSFALFAFLQNMFVAHDAHHQKQIEKYLTGLEK